MQSLQDPNRQQMLANIHRFWIAGLLRESLKGGAFINPVFHLNRSAIVGSGEQVPLGEQRIETLYDELNESMLILGEPGSGKTTVLLELTNVLLQRATDDPQYPIPVIFNLASWAKDRLPFQDWLVEELNAKYQVPLAVALDWVRQNQLALLLDGLDEVASPYRNECVSAIKAYRQHHHKTPMVVCSRIQDYAQLSQRLDLAGALIIQPFRDEQIAAYVDSLGSGAEAMRALLARDKHLRKLARTPLMLNIMTIVAEDLTSDADFATLPEWRDYLFALYVQQMFKRRSKTKSIPPEETVGALRWLAEEMEKRRQTVFYIENLGPDWLTHNWQRAFYALISRLSFGIGVGALAGGLSTLVMSILIWLLLGQPPAFYSASFELSGLFALVYIALIGTFTGLLLGGIFLGASGVLAYTIERLKQKSLSFQHNIRRRAEVLALGMGGGLAFGVLAYLWAILASGSFIIWGNGVSMSVLGSLLYFVAHGFIFGFIGSVIALITDAVLKHLGRPLTQLVYAISGGFVALGWLGGISLLHGVYGLSHVTALIVWLMGALVGLLAGGWDDEVIIAESVRWRWNRRWAIIGVVIAVIITVLDYWQITMYNSSYDLARLVQTFLPFATFGLLAGGVGAGLRKNETVESRIHPNDGIRKSARNALRVMAAFGAAGMVISFVVMLSALLSTTHNTTSQVIREMLNAMILGVGGGMAVGLMLGGSEAVIKHIVLRFLLIFDRRVPLQLAKRLDHAANLILLRKVGGGYLFIHRYLLEYFAHLPDDAPEEKPKTRLLPAPDEEIDKDMWQLSDDDERALSESY